MPHFQDPGNVTTTSSSYWLAWAQGKVGDLLSCGSPLFVGFTSARCATCLYNKETTLANTELLANLDAK